VREPPAIGGAAQPVVVATAAKELLASTPTAIIEVEVDLNMYVQTGALSISRGPSDVEV
jgi:hypothetical protein